MPDFADTAEIDTRRREVQFLMNIIEPDPEYQPLFVSDESRLNMCTRNDDEVVSNRIQNYFGPKIEIDISMTIVDFIDSIKRQIPNWPDDKS